ncbi:mono/diheme cytochrome c family protein [Silvibacterium bohemicum]|uniref:Mono/diheme cytochrome c family protein n=1 Tax=Silvibacterium bohemicum TaxID=1577686 RepID=A0A841K0S8_9BACT|nr:cytochrome c [Silvibacterium bohemicum]MBB6146585.1 mono/diheme cytochrome c family protein [Silvibacterium bohemicum]
MRAPRRSVILAILAMASVAGCRVKTPGRFETTAVQWTKHHVTVGNRAERNPLPATAENIDDGKKTFGYYCVSCHGRDAQNTGVPFAAQISPPIPSLASAQVQSYSDGQLKWVIDNGIFPSGMPASKGTLGDEEVWKMILFIRHLPPAGSLGDPKAYSGDEYGSDDSGKSKSE